MAEDLVSIGIAYDTSQLLTGSRQVQDALRQVEQAEKSAQTATRALEQSSGQAATALTNESQAARQASQAVQQTAQATTQAAGATQTFTQSTERARDAFGRFVSAGDRATQTTQGIGGAAGESATFMQRLNATLGDFGRQVGAFALAQAGVQGLQQASRTAQAAVADVVRTGLQMAQLRGSFTAITGSVSAGSREFQFAVATANRLGLELQTVAESYRSLSAATRGTQLAGADTRALFVALSNAAQAYGLSTEQLGRAMTAFQQIISKGKVSQEELRQQLAEAIPGAVQIAARAFGTNTAALEGMLEKGVEASDFVRRFTAQLASETPAAAERAGKGIAQLGNEILLLKNYIAQSGLLSWLDSAAGKAAAVARGLREVEEARAAQAQARTTGTLGPGVTLDKLAADDRQKLLDVSGKLATAEQELLGIQEARKQRAFGVLTPLITTAGEEARAKASVEALRAEQAEIAKTATLRSQEAQRAAARQKEITSMTADEKALTRDKEAANKQLTQSLDEQKKAQDALNKAAALAPELYGKATGTLKEQNTLLQERIKVNEKALETATKALVERPATAGPAPAELVARHDALRKAVRDDTEALERNKQAIEDNEKAKRKALQDTEEARRKKEQHDEEERRKDEQQKEEVRRTHFQNFEALKRLEAQYTSVRAARDDDRASMLAASLATSQYAEKAKELAQRIEDVQRVEAKLPELRSQAAGSAARLTEIDRLMKQFEPRHRGESTEERLTRTYTELANTPGATMGKLSEASETMRETLDTEQWTAWRDTGLEALHDVTSEFARMAFAGKLSFTELANHAVEQLFRIASEATMKALFKSGGWLEQGLQAGLQLLGIFGGGATSGTLPTTMSAYTAQAAAGRFSGRQHGGDVQAGRPYWVGEAGPELIVPKMSGTVIPHGQTGGGVVIHNHFSIHTPDVQGLVHSQGAVQRMIARSVSTSYRAI